MPPSGGIFGNRFLFFLRFVFALLIRNTAAGFASRLAGGLALTATAFFRAFAQIFGIQSLNPFHIVILREV